MSIEDGFLQLLDDNGGQKEDLQLPAGDLGTEIEAKYEEGKELTVSYCAFFNFLHLVFMERFP